MVSPDGQRIVFIRSRAGDDPINCLYVLDVGTGDERLIADPLVLLMQVDPDDLPPEEHARRERMRETATVSRRSPPTRPSPSSPFRWPDGCSSPV